MSRVDFETTDQHRPASPDLPIDPPQPVEKPNLEVDNKIEQSANIIPWHTFLQTADEREIKERFAGDVQQILSDHVLQAYCTLVLLEPDNPIDTTDLDRVFSALSQLNPDRSKDVMLLLLSRGGSIESAYQISKLCKSFSGNRFVAVVPRYAKSAATLIAIGADEIHMGPLGQLGPIDPQLEGLPALGVSQALKTMASVAQAFPGSADMFARYLRMVLTVEQIGYCDRISESAVQYAERLLSAKLNLPKPAGAVARDLVHEYKDHGFVIDIDEARMHLGSEWIKSDTQELAAAEEIYNQFEMVNFFLGVGRSKRLIAIGGAGDRGSILILKKN
jgi:hypothetical protein